MRKDFNQVEPEHISSVGELRVLYRAAEARSARLRLIVDVRELIDAGPFRDAAPRVLSKLMTFTASERAVLRVAAVAGHDEVRIVTGEAEGEGDVLFSSSTRSGRLAPDVTLTLMSSTRAEIEADDAKTLSLVLTQLSDAVLLERQTQERLGLLDELSAREAELASLVGRLIEAQEQERRRVALDLHDGAAQSIAGIAFRLQTLAARADESTGFGLALQDAADLARQSVSEIRTAIADLRPPELDDLGLLAALKARVDTIRDVEVDLELDESASQWPKTVSLVLYRVAQEAMANVIKHASATRFLLRVFEHSRHACLEVIDNGRGFAVKTAAQAPGEQLGIIGMRERLVLLGGALEIRTSSGHGTTVRASVPLQRSSTVAQA